MRTGTAVKRSDNHQAAAKKTPLKRQAQQHERKPQTQSKPSTIPLTTARGTGYRPSPQICFMSQKHGDKKQVRTNEVARAVATNLLALAQGTRNHDELAPERAHPQPSLQHKNRQDRGRKSGSVPPRCRGLCLPPQEETFSPLQQTQSPRTIANSIPVLGRQLAEHKDGLRKNGRALQKCEWCQHGSMIQSVVKSLLKKYRPTREAYDAKVISNLMYNERVGIVAVFKDYLILDDTSEFLRRFYDREESLPRLSTLCDFYHSYSQVFPNYFGLAESKYLYKNIRKKQKAIDKQQELEAADVPEEKVLNDRLLTTHFMNGGSTLWLSSFKELSRGCDPNFDSPKQSCIKWQVSLRCGDSCCSPQMQHLADVPLADLVQKFLRKDTPTHNLIANTNANQESKKKLKSHVVSNAITTTHRQNVMAGNNGKHKSRRTRSQETATQPHPQAEQRKLHVQKKDPKQKKPQKATTPHGRSRSDLLNRKSRDLNLRREAGSKTLGSQGSKLDPGLLNELLRASEQPHSRLSDPPLQKGSKGQSEQKSIRKRSPKSRASSVGSRARASGRHSASTRLLSLREGGRNGLQIVSSQPTPALKLGYKCLNLVTAEPCTTLSSSRPQIGHVIGAVSLADQQGSDCAYSKSIIHNILSQESAKSQKVGLLSSVAKSIKSKQGIGTQRGQTTNAAPSEARKSGIKDSKPRSERHPILQFTQPEIKKPSPTLKKQLAIEIDGTATKKHYPKLKHKTRETEHARSLTPASRSQVKTDYINALRAKLQLQKHEIFLLASSCDPSAPSVRLSHSTAASASASASTRNRKGRFSNTHTMELGERKKKRLQSAGSRSSLQGLLNSKIAEVIKQSHQRSKI